MKRLDWFIAQRYLSARKKGRFLSIITWIALGGVTVGVGALVAQSVVIFTVIKFAGALYLVYLGVQAIRHRADAAAAVNGDAPTRSHWRQLGEGFVVGVTNPKTIAFFVAVLPQFVDLSAGMVPLQMIELGLIFFAIALISDGIWALVAAAAREWFGRSPKRIATLSATGGGLMIGLGGILLFTGNKH